MKSKSVFNMMLAMSVMWNKHITSYELRSGRSRKRLGKNLIKNDADKAAIKKAEEKRARKLKARGGKRYE